MEKKQNYLKKLEITGIDLNKTRIENAKKHVKTNSKNIKKNFYVDDLNKMNIPSLKKKNLIIVCAPQFLKC